MSSSRRVSYSIVRISSMVMDSIGAPGWQTTRGSPVTGSVVTRPDVATEMGSGASNPFRSKSATVDITSRPSRSARRSTSPMRSSGSSSKVLIALLFLKGLDPSMDEFPRRSRLGRVPEVSAPAAAREDSRRLGNSLSSRSEFLPSATRRRRKSCTKLGYAAWEPRAYPVP